MLDINSKIFQDYAKHILASEGKLSKNPKDTTAAKMVSPGQVHTNRGVTWYVYRDNAAKLGLNSAYESFVQMGDAGAIKFVYLFYLQIGKNLPALSSIALTESAWASGTGRAKIILIDALKSFGINAVNFDAAVKAAATVDDKKLALEIVKQQQQFYKKLATGNPDKYGSFIKGWTNRAKNLFKIIHEGNTGTPLLLIGFIIASYFWLK